MAKALDSTGLKGLSLVSKQNNRLEHHQPWSVSQGWKLINSWVIFLPLCLTKDQTVSPKEEANANTSSTTRWKWLDPLEFPFKAWLTKKLLKSQLRSHLQAPPKQPGFSHSNLPILTKLKCGAWQHGFCSITAHKCNAWPPTHLACRHHQHWS